MTPATLSTDPATDVKRLRGELEAQAETIEALESERAEIEHLPAAERVPRRHEIEKRLELARGIHADLTRDIAEARRARDVARVRTDEEEWVKRFDELRPVAERARQSLRDALEDFAELLDAENHRRRLDKRDAHLRSTGRIPADTPLPNLTDPAGLLGVQGPTLRRVVADLRRASNPILSQE